jgi:hypothetical protein
MDFAAIVLVWTCVSLFVVTAIITVGALLGWWVFGGGAAKQHDYYLKNLFRALVVEIVTVVVGFFGLYVKSQIYQTQTDTRYTIVEVQQNWQDRVVNLESMLQKINRRLDAIQSSPTIPENVPRPARWELVRAGFDCPGHDIGETSGSIPEATKCLGANTTAVCWDGGLFVNRSRSGGWCTYKSVTADQCKGGTSPGQVYQCIPG